MSRKRIESDEEGAVDTAGVRAKQPTCVAPKERASSEPQRSLSVLPSRDKGMVIPYPFGIQVDTVAGVRLFESKREQQMVIKLQEKPSPAVIDLLEEAGYHWKPSEKSWVHQVWPASALLTRIRAGRLYREICLVIRKEKGFAYRNEGSTYSR